MLVHQCPSAADMLVGYYNDMVEPKPFVVRAGKEFRRHQLRLRKGILEAIGLSPLPERMPLRVQELGALDHPWCTVQAVTYRLWPRVRARAFLYRPKEFRETPAPAMLCPVGHWPDGNAHRDVQTRCMNFARLGYVVLCTTQHHFEDLAAGVSHQTLMVWNNMRGLDLLESLPEVDAARIGCAGCSGGGLQTQMLAALDERVQAASIVGITCDYREIMFPYRAHCTCNHWPGAMQLTDQPEISALALPRPIQFLTMDDWTRNFERDNLPKIRALYKANGVGERVDHQYWPTPHEYDRAKRRRTYQWMERWLRNKGTKRPPTEPETQTFAPQELLALFSKDGEGAVIRDARFRQLGTFYRNQYGAKPRRSVKSLGRHEVAEQRKVLKRLLGLDALLPRPRQQTRGTPGTHGGLLLEHFAFPSEGTVSVPTLLLHPRECVASRIRVFCDDRAKEERLESRPIAQAARSGALVVLPDVRFVGALSLDSLKGCSKELVKFPIAAPCDELTDGDYAQFWTRNGVLWGHPLPGMAATDILAVLDGVLRVGRRRGLHVNLSAQGQVAAGALFAACLDDRIDTFDIDLGGHKFADGTLPLVPDILRYGDADDWLAFARAVRRAGEEGRAEPAAQA